MDRPWEKYYSEAAKAFELSDMPARRIGDYLDFAAAEHGSKPALTTTLPTGGETTITYAELKTHAEAFAAYLREVVGLAPGDTVALMTPNCIGFGVVSMGIAKAGCVATLVNPLYTAPELEHQLADSQAKVLVIIDLFGDKADKVVASTGIRQVVTLSIVDFFPPLKKLLLGAVLKHVRKVIPAMTTPHVTLAQALSQGARAARGADVAAYAADVAEDDTSLYQYTSGTTGRSKGAELSHVSILTNAYQAYLMVDGPIRPTGETALVVLPLYHITAYVLIFLAGLRNGSHLVMAPSPRPPSNLKSAFEKHEITWFTGINTLFAALLAEPWFKKEMFENVRFCGSGGAAQTTGVAQKWRDFTGVEINQGYGMTEVCGVLTLNPPGHNQLGKVGIPVPGMEVRIVDDEGNAVPIGEPGEVIAKGPTLMKGYLNRAEATGETIRQGWLYSGDIGVMNEDGFLEIVDRKKDMILVSGFNVSPNEIEDAISKLPGVVQVGVIGVPDEKTGESPAAFVVKGDDALDADAIITAVRDSLTNYKIPKSITFVDEVPTTLSGKVLRRQLRETHLKNTTA